MSQQVEIAMHEAQRRIDVGLMRPHVDSSGRIHMTANVNELALNPAAKPRTLTFQPTPQLNATNTLTYEAWVEVDEQVMGVARRERTILADMEAAGLTTRVDFGKTLYTVQRRTDTGEAEISMSPTTLTNKDRPGYELDQVPVPIVSKGFEYNIRETDGRPYLVRDSVEDATAGVERTVQRMILGTVPVFSYGNAKAYGLYTHPYRITLAVGDWNALTPEQVVQKVNAMKQAALDRGVRGPFVLYMPSGYAALFGLDYKAESDRTLYERITADPEIQEVKVDYFLRAKEPLLISWSSGYNRIVVGLETTAVQWGVMGPLATEYKVLCAKAPLFRAFYSDFDGQLHTAWVHGTEV